MWNYQCSWSRNSRQNFQTMSQKNSKMSTIWSNSQPDPIGLSESSINLIATFITTHCNIICTIKKSFEDDHRFSTPQNQEAHSSKSLQYPLLSSSSQKSSQNSIAGSMNHSTFLHHVVHILNLQISLIHKHTVQKHGRHQHLSILSLTLCSQVVDKVVIIIFLF